MDSARAARITNELKHNEIDGWVIIDQIDHGKSAVVLRAEKGGETAAIKVFDPDLVERFGREIQLERINRERGLIGQSHPHLIQIIGSGACEDSGYLYIITEYLQSKNLNQVLNSAPRHLIFQIIGQVASAAKFLEDIGLAHRDIKPENIVISNDFMNATLLDLGVLRPVGISNLTDHNEQKAFLGTLQYSPPELLYREEEDTLEGWRSITFYQLGAVLHDLIMGKPLFHDHLDPFARLVDAVRGIDPVISAEDVDSHLILLAKSCLLKNHKTRLSLVTWKQFLELPEPSQETSEYRDRIKKKQLIIQSKASPPHSDLDGGIDSENKILNTLTEEIIKTIRNICTSYSDCFPRFQIDGGTLVERGKEMLSVYFRKSSKHALENNIRLYIYLSLMDASANVVDLRYSLIISEDHIRSVDVKFEDTNTIFQGPFDSNTVSTELEKLLFSTIDKALDQQLDA